MRGALTARLRRRAWEVTAVYVAFAGLWILLSDRILGLIVRDPDRLIQLSVFKGTFFVLVTGVLLFFLLRRLPAQVEESTLQLSSTTSLLEVAGRVAHLDSCSIPVRSP